MEHNTSTQFVRNEKLTKVECRTLHALRVHVLTYFGLQTDFLRSDHKKMQP